MKHLLIVDDSATIRRMVMASLRELPDVRFEEASSGLEAIERLALATVDMIILDLNMPDMHGLDVLKFVRGHSAYSAIPVVVLTTRNDDSSRAGVIAAGASLYLTKPFEPGSLARAIAQLL